MNNKIILQSIKKSFFVFEINMESLNIESLTSSLVREYLHKKGCKNTLAAMDLEFPRPLNSISNRLKLINAMHIGPWVKQNKLSFKKYETLMEIVMYNTLKYTNNTSSQDFIKSSSHLQQQKSSTSKCDTSVSSDNTKSLNGDVNSNSSLENTSNYFKQDAIVSSKPHSLLKPAFRQQSSVEVNLEDFIDSDVLTSKSLYTKPTRPVKSTFSDYSNRLKVSNRTEEMSRGEGYRNSKFSSTKNDQVDFKEFLDFLNDDNNTSDFGSSKSSYSKPSTSSFIPENRKAIVNNIEKFKTKTDLASNMSTDSLIKFSDHNINKKDLIFDADLASHLRVLLFGTDKRGFPPEWTEQSFKFNDCEKGEPPFLRIGIVQKKGGPCGLLSAVQALVLKHYLFGENKTEQAEMDEVYSYKRTQSLEKSIVEMIWRCRVKENKVYLAVLSMYKQFTLPIHSQPDGVTECVKLISCSRKQDLMSAVHSHINEYEKGKGSCVLLLYSAILTHGISEVRSEMDENGGKLMGLHNYCTQEMINLLLHGKAYSNAFDNSVSLGENTMLRGITNQSEVGLLSLFEHYDSIKIGEFYKSPKFPIWLVCSESHFTVLFSLSFNATKGDIFDLYYYDGLANQDEIIKLTVNCQKKCSEADIVGTLVPPIEHCIRTKWSKAVISWNETEPIL